MVVINASDVGMHVHFGTADQSWFFYAGVSYAQEKEDLPVLGAWRKQLFCFYAIPFLALSDRGHLSFAI